MLLTMEQNGKQIASVQYNNEDEALSAFEDIIKESKQNGYSVYNKTLFKAELIPSNAKYSKMFLKPLIIGIE